MTIMTTKLYEIISATQLMHEPWHFVIKVADANNTGPTCGQIYSFVDEDNKKLELIPVENSPTGMLTMADINALARQNRELKEKFDKISNDYDSLISNLKDLLKDTKDNYFDSNGRNYEC